MEWYYAIDNEQKGPVDEDTFKDLISGDVINSETLVWNQSLDGWKPLRETGFIEEPPEIPLHNEIPDIEDSEEFPEFERMRDYEPVKRVEEYRVEFTGRAGEYFKIWIVNLFFTIITLGIYAAWAKVRNRQYIYANTSLSGDTFDFLGNPVAILKGNLILAAVIGSSYLLRYFDPKYAPIGSILFYVVLPFLIYKSMQFLARNSAWRNVRFSFSGTLKESYFIFFVIPLIVFICWLGLSFILVGNPIQGTYSSSHIGQTFGNIIGLMILVALSAYFVGIYILFRMKKYFFSHMSYGNAQNIFSGTPGKFYGTYTIAGAMYIAGMLIVSAGFAGVMGAIGISGPKSPESFVPVMVIMYIIIIVGFLAIKMFIYSQINNYCWSELQIDNLTFKTTYETIPMAGIMATNILAIIFSFGLMIPWAKIRMTRYKLENIIIYTDDGFDNFRAAESSEVSALGDAAMDAFDMDISL